MKVDVESSQRRLFEFTIHALMKQANCRSRQRIETNMAQYYLAPFKNVASVFSVENILAKIIAQDRDSQC